MTGSSEPAHASSDAEPADPYRDGGLVRIRLDLGYDGTPFSGWARQPGRRTIQAELETALATILRLDPPPTTTVAGRTDAGVHARGQVCHFDLDRATWGAVPSRGQATAAEALVHRLDGLLPAEIRVHRAAIAPPGFDARFAALSRRYAYRICDDPAVADPLRRDVVPHRHRLDVAAMDKAAAPLVGEHDFGAFCKPRAGASTTRRVLSLRCTRDADGLVVVGIQADAFCHHMVRSITGALVAVGDARRVASWPGAVLAAAVRDPSVTVLPPGGLTLESVTYPPDDELAARSAITKQTRTPASGGDPVSTRAEVP